jgi:hypothetical protein
LICGISTARPIEERVAFQAQLRDLTWLETKKRVGLGEHEGPHSPNALAPTSAAARAVHLMYLEVAAQAGDIAQRLTADATTRAGRAGASYADLGLATGISRQAARKRWPNAVGTQWTLYTLTGNSRPHCMATQVFRSSGKAIETGRTAVDEGALALASDGAVGAVVINSAREAVWASYFNDGTWAPEEIVLPEDLQTVPAPGTPEHGDWLHKFDQFITRHL